MSKIVCIDFGTSSIRAAVREGANEPEAFRLGDVFRSSIDSASIPSACFIGIDGTACFGEEALRRGLSGELAALYETSPKRWLSEASLDELMSPALPRSPLTRLDLVKALLAQAWSAVLAETNETIGGLQRQKLRVAHPVWTKQVRGRRDALDNALHESLALAGQTDQPVTLTRLEELTKLISQARTTESDVDVEEPIAAALQIHGSNRHYREVCMVVDVGAGTTDIATFVSQTPTYHGSDAFILATDPISVPQAGDVIDHALVRLIQERAPTARTGAGAADLSRRQRSLKEDLFNTNHVVFQRANVTLKELEESDDVRRMAKVIENAVTQQLRDSQLRLKVFRGIGAEGHINVVFAGGGAGIRFIEDAVTEGVAAGPFRMPVRIDRKVLADSGLPADAARLAVCLGGTTPKTLWPKTRMDEPKFYRGLPV